MASADDVAARRDRLIGDMGPDELHAYRIGLAHAYADVFAAFAATPGDASAVVESVDAQWNDVRTTWEASL
jgi:hypothetical protein